MCTAQAFLGQPQFFFTIVRLGLFFLFKPHVLQKVT